MSAHVEIAKEGAVQTVRLNRAEKKNALTGEMYRALTEALRDADAAGGIAVTVMLGQPGIFCAGNDLADFLAAGQGGAALHGFGFLQALAEHEKPLIAAVDGPAIGIGTTLMFHCDLVFASPRALFQTPFVDLGLVPEAASSLLGPRLMGHARAFELLAMGEPFTADRAREAGFVNHIVPPEAVEGAALKAAEALAAKPREAIRISRRLLKGDPAPIKNRMEEEGALFLERIKSQEAMAAFSAFLQKAPKAAQEK
ncbi:MAG: crotonase/enoyl-CoA hydratase family protein [Rhodomicrobium sp.]